MTSVLLRVFALLAALVAVAIGVAEGRTAVHQLIADRIWLNEGFRPPLRLSYDRAIATAPYEGWIMRLRTQVGSRWFYALDKAERRKL